MDGEGDDGLRLLILDSPPLTSSEIIYCYIAECGITDQIGPGTGNGGAECFTAIQLIQPCSQDITIPDKTIHMKEHTRLTHLRRIHVAGTSQWGMSFHWILNRIVSNSWEGWWISSWSGHWSTDDINSLESTTWRLLMTLHRRIHVGKMSTTWSEISDVSQWHWPWSKHWTMDDCGFGFEFSR